MRIRLTDVDWQWLRTADHYVRQIRIDGVSVESRHLSLADQYSILLRAAEVAYNHAVLSRFASVAASLDLAILDMVVPARDAVATSDKATYSFTKAVADSANGTDWLAFTWSAPLFSQAAAQDLLAFSMLAAPYVEQLISTDFIYARVESLSKSSAGAADYQNFAYVCSVSDIAAAGSYQAFELDFLLMDSAPAVDRIECTFEAGLFDAVDGVDRLSVTIVALLEDSVTASSAFVISGLSFQSTESSVLVSDAFYNTLASPAPDAVGASDTVEIGIRYAIDFYFGGLAIGGSPFGGRV